MTTDFEFRLFSLSKTLLVPAVTVDVKSEVASLSDGVEEKTGWAFPHNCRFPPSTHPHAVDESAAALRISTNLTVGGTSAYIVTGREKRCYGRSGS